MVAALQRGTNFSVARETKGYGGGGIAGTGKADVIRKPRPSFINSGRGKTPFHRFICGIPVAGRNSPAVRTCRIPAAIGRTVQDIIRREININKASLRIGRTRNVDINPLINYSIFRNADLANGRLI